jgi:dihydrofolate reductase
MAIIGIVAVDRNGAIGKAGGLPWHYSADLKFFRRQTTGNAVVMGRKTWLTIKKPLKDRLNVVMSRGAEIEPQEGLIVMRDKPSVLSLFKYLACDLFVIGGEQTFRAFLRDIDRWVVTEVPLTVEGADTFVPPDYLEGFGPYDSLGLEEDLKVTFYRRDERK